MEPFAYTRAADPRAVETIAHLGALEQVEPLHEVRAIGRTQLRPVAAHDVGLLVRDGADVDDETRLDRQVARIPQEHPRPMWRSELRLVVAQACEEERTLGELGRSGVVRVHVAHVRREQQRWPRAAQHSDEQIRARLVEIGRAHV